ncbi:hypothetical protein ACFWR9_11320 [Streptomyces sp. NPDC058534]|uniref:hypothetical protein n=1 Tax=Streptomyces sp. NPDC058534 TaxID=3346541 RepID=UPI00365C3523
MNPPIPRLFTLRRDRDVTGVSGPGDVADGVQWADGNVDLRWRDRPSTSVWDSLELMLSVHGHDGATRVVWLDDAPCLRCGHGEGAHNVSGCTDCPGGWRAGHSFAPARDDTIPVADHLEAASRAQQEIERLRGVAGRAYLLADRWEAAHGSATFLVRAAGVELREALDGAGPTTHTYRSTGCLHGEHDYCKASVGRAGAKAPASCKFCAAPCICACHREPAPTGIRGLLKHIGINTSGRDNPVAGRVVDAAQDADDLVHVRQHYLSPAAEPCTKHRGREERQRYGCNGPDPADQNPAGKGPLTGIEVRDPCPYCEGCPLIPRALMDDHVREHHPEVREGGPGIPVPSADAGEVKLARAALLARVGEDQADVVDRLIRAVERRNYCDLPHEMEA